MAGSPLKIGTTRKTEALKKARLEEKKAKEKEKEQEALRLQVKQRDMMNLKKKLGGENQSLSTHTGIWVENI